MRVLRGGLSGLLQLHSHYNVFIYIGFLRIYTMVKKIKLIEKLSGAYDKLSSRTNSYHNGGTASKGLCTDLEYTLGLDNRGKMDGMVGIILLISVITVAFILRMGSQILKDISISEVRLLVAILIIVAIIVFILGIKFLVSKSH